MVYLQFVLIGLLGANCLPHLVKGLTGEWHMTPFAKPSPPGVNVLWGAANLTVALWLFHAASGERFTFEFALLSFVAGILMTGLSLVKLWKDDPVARGQRSRR